MDENKPEQGPKIFHINTDQNSRVDNPQMPTNPPAFPRQIITDTDLKVMQLEQEIVMLKSFITSTANNANTALNGIGQG